MKIELTQNWTIGFERTAPGCLYISLPHSAAIWIERASKCDRAGWKPEVEKVRGEYLVWWRAFHAIYSPPGLTPRGAEAGLKVGA